MRHFLAAVAATSLVVTPIAAAAQSAAGLGDLVGARGSSFESEMASRGYAFVKKEGEAQYWWNASRKACAAATIANGRVDTLNSANASNCNQGGGDKTLAGIAVGAAAIGLIAALSSHHKSNDNRNKASYNQEYERGYHDAMYGAHYATADSEPYHNGYMAGETERNNRKHANSVLVRGAPAVAQNACKERGDSYWGVPSGSTVPVSVYDYGQGRYEITMASGERRAGCNVTGAGRISSFSE